MIDTDDAGTPFRCAKCGGAVEWEVQRAEPDVGIRYGWKGWRCAECGYIDDDRPVDED